MTRWRFVNPRWRDRSGPDVWTARWLARSAWAVLAIGVLTGLTVWGQFDTRGAAGPFALDVVIGVVCCALVPILIRWPILGAIALAVLAAVSPAATPAATLGTLQVAQRRRFGVAISVAVLGIATHSIRWAWRPVNGLSFPWWLLLVVLAHAALVGWGALNRTHRDLICSLRERADRAEAEQGRRVAEARVLERNQIAREMHDVLAHRLSLLATYAGALEYRPDASPQQLSQAAGVIRTGVHQALGDLRDVIAVLRDSDAADADRPQPTLADVPGLIEESRDCGTVVNVRDGVRDPAELPAATGRTSYRVIQEALTNARKHASGQPVTVVLDGGPGGRLVIEVSNPTDVSRVRQAGVPGTGTGLIGLTERVQLAGGVLDHYVTSEGDFRLRAWLPWPA